MKDAVGFTRDVKPVGWARGDICSRFVLRMTVRAAVLLAVGSGTAFAQWQSRDIGTTTGGSTTEAGGTVSLSGSGRDIWNESDGFRYYYQEVAGEFDLVVRVRSLQNTHGWAKAGIMARQTIDVGSSHASIIASVAHGTAFQWRTDFNWSTFSDPPSENGGPPRWLRLVRILKQNTDSRNFYHYYTSLDGVTWSGPILRQPPTADIPGGRVLVGLAVTSHNDGVLSRAEFDQLSLTLPPNAPSGLRIVRRGPNGQMDLAWNDDSLDETGFVIEAKAESRHAAEFVTLGQVGPNITTFSARGLSTGNYYEFRIKAMKDTVGAYSPKVMARTTPTVITSILGAGPDSITVRITEEAYTLSGTTGGPYAIERSTDNVTYVQIASGLTRTGGTTSTTICDYVDRAVTPGTPYYYRSRYLDTNGDSSAYATTPAPATTGATPSGPPAAPSYLMATAISASEIQLNWTDNSTNETDFQIERSTDGVNFSASFSAGGANQTTKTDSGLPYSTTFYYRVRAVNATGPSGYSNIASGFTQAPAVPAPSNLHIPAYSASAVHLAWTDNAGDETGFDLERATSNGAFMRIAVLNSNVTSYADQTVAAGTSYSYRLRTMRTWQHSAYSNTATVTTSVGWTSSDIGLVGAAGSTSGTGESRIISGSGADIWDSADAFHYHYMSWSGLGEIYVRVTSLDYTNGWAKAGVMFRESLAAGSPHGFMAVSAGNGTAFQWRSTAGSFTQSISGARSSQLPVWLKLTRNASTVTGYESADGVTWTRVGQATIAMSNSLYVGLAVTSHNYGVLTRAQFDNLKVWGGESPDTTAPAAPSNLVATAGASGQINLQWSDNSSNETAFVVENSRDNLNFTFLSRVAANATTHATSGLSPSTVYYFRVYAENGTVLSARSNLASATTGAPQTWNDVDIGAVAAAGWGSGSGGSATVSGSGADIWETSDEFHYRYQAWNGDGVFITRVMSMTNTHGWAKTGIMLRENLTPGSRHVMVCVNPGNAAGMFARTATGGATDFTLGVYEIQRMWLKLERSGNVFRAYQSANGTEWIAIGSPITLALPASLYAGLAVTSHADGVLCTAAFENISFGGGSSTPPPPPPPPPSTWAFGDVGAVGIAGSNSSGTASITVSASGSDIWGTADAFRFVYRSLTGDGVVDARVDSLQNTNVWAKAGVMIRESLSPGARNVFSFVTPAWNGAGAQIRTTAGGQTTGVAGPRLNPPGWVRLQRSGSVIIASTSADGQTWSETTRWMVDFGATAYFGFAVTSHDNSQLTTAVFSEPSVR